MTFRRPHITPAMPVRRAPPDISQSVNLCLVTNYIPIWTVFESTYKPLPSVPFYQQNPRSFYAVTSISGISAGMGRGQGNILRTAFLSATGSSTSFGTARLVSYLPASRSFGAGFGGALGSPVALLTAQNAVGKGAGRAGISLGAALAGAGSAISTGAAGIAGRTGLVARGAAMAFGRLFSPGGIALVASSIAAAKGRFGGMSGTTSLSGRSTAQAKAPAGLTTSFFATAKSIAAGKGALLVQVATSTVALLLARSSASAKGSSSVTTKTSLSGASIAGATSRAGAIFKAVLVTKTAAMAKGAGLIQALVSLSTRSSAMARGIAFDGADAILSAVSLAAATGRVFTTGKLSLLASGAAKSFGAGLSTVSLAARSMARATGTLWMFVPSGRIVKAFHLASARTVQVPLGGSGGSMLVWQTKDPNDILDYDIDWTLALSSGDSIISSNWTMFQTDGALTIQTNPAPSYINTSTKLWLSGGTVGEGYILRNTITTAIGDKMEESVLILVRTK